MQKIVIVFITLLIIGIAIYITVLILLKKKGYSPKYLVDESSIQDTVTCDPKYSIQKCTKLGDPCIQCKDGIFSCQNVDINGITLSDIDGTKYNVPEGKWCLPAKVDSVPCNPYTSDAVLTKVSDSLYEWRCYCKNPEWVSSGGINKDCNVQLMCSVDRNSENKMVYCPDSDYQIQRKDGAIIYTCKDGKDPVLWDSKSQVELQNVFCQCSPGSYFYENKPLGIKDCIPNPCGDRAPAYDNNNNMFCICDPGQISCKDLPDEKLSECKVGCVQDYCIPKVLSEKCKNKDPKDPDYSSMCECKYDSTSKKCVCGSAYQYINDTNFITNGYCFPTDEVCPGDCDCDGECSNSFAQNCKCKRGGTCAPCLTDTGGMKANYPQSYCLNCKPYMGYISKNQYPTDKKGNIIPEALSSFCQNPKVDCTTCGLNFSHCTSDDECCSGRCHSNGDCQPCNGYNGWGDKPEEWDSNCKRVNSSSGRGTCNVYAIGKQGDRDLYQGFCEVNPCDPEKDENCISREVVKRDSNKYKFTFKGKDFN